MDRVAVAIGTAEVVGAIALVITTFVNSEFTEMRFIWWVLAMFMALEGADRLYDKTDL
jgi:hypothetical protein